MKLKEVFFAILEQEDTVSYINITGGEIDGNQVKEKVLKLDAARVIDGSVRKTIEEFITNFISGEIAIKFVVDGKTIQLNTFKKDDKITYIEIELSAVDDTELNRIKTNLTSSKIKFVEEGKALKVSNSSGYTTEQFVTLVINIIKMVATDGSK